jgi:hypothetical protein
MARRRARLVRERARRRGLSTLATQCALYAGRSLGGNRTRTARTREIALRLLARRFRRLPLLRRGKSNASAPRLGKADRDGLLRRSRAVFPFADMINLFSDEFTSLGRRRFPLALVAARSFDSLFFRHVDSSEGNRLASRGPTAATSLHPARIARYIGRKFDPLCAFSPLHSARASNKRHAQPSKRIDA